MKRYFIPVIFCLAAGTALAGSWETSSFRTANGQLVRVGMTKAEVRRDAGSPLDKATRVKSEGSAGAKRRGDVWTYKGSDGIYAVSFNADRVAKIEVAPFRDR